MRGGLLLLAALALLARAAFQLEVRADEGPVGSLATHLLGDERAYDAFARASAAGGVERTRAFYQEPLYGWLLGRLYVVAPPEPLPDDPAVVPHDGVHTAVLLAQHLVGVAVVVLVALLGQRALGRRAGWIAGLLAALSGPAIFHEAMLLKTSLSLLVLLVALILWLDLLEATGARPGRALLLGLVLGLGILLRGNLYLLLAGVAASLVVPLGTPRRRPGSAALVVAGALAALSPVTSHNLRLGDPVLSTYQAGTNVAIGQPDDDDPTRGVIYEPLRAGRGDARYEEIDAVAVAEAARGTSLRGRDVSSWWWAEAWRRIAARPGVAAARTAYKLAYLFHPREVPDVKEWTVFASALPWLATPLSNMVLVGPLALLGFVLLPWRRQPGLLVVRTTLLVVAATLALFYVMGRYRLTAAPALWILAAGAVDRGLGLLAGPAAVGRKLAVVLAGAGLPALAWLVHLPPDLATGTISWANAATIARHEALDATDPDVARAHRDRAVAWTERSLDLAPLFPTAHMIRLRTLAMTADGMEARAAEAREQGWRCALVLEGLRTGVDVRVRLGGSEAELRADTLRLADRAAIPGGRAHTAPLLAEVCLFLASQLREADELTLALRLVERSVSLAPDDPAALVQRGVVLRRAGRLAEAESSYRAARAAGADTLELHNNLGNLLIQLGRPAEAIPELERALQLSPGHPLVLRNLERARQAAEEAR